LATMEIEPVTGLAYVAIGFILTYLSLEVAWHFTACKIKMTSEKLIKPCFFKQIKIVALATVHDRRA
jgi:hypothetical protein